MTVKHFFSKPWYPFLLTLFFVSHGFAENFLLITAGDVGMVFLVYLAGCSAMYFLSWLFYRDLQKAALFTFLLLAFDYFFGYAHDIIKGVFPGSFIIKYSVILSTALVFFIVFAILLKKRIVLRERLAIYLNLLLIIFIGMDIAVIARKSIFATSVNEDPVTLSCKEKFPDVYFIITDEYSGRKGLKEVCQYDNSAFIDSLQGRGFYVAANSRSNYNYTTYSIASLLQMDYLPLKGKELDPFSDATPLLKMIFNNKVTHFFKRSGYTIYNYSAFDISDQPPQNANSFIPARTKLFTSQTLLNRLRRDVWIHVAGFLDLKPVLKDYVFQNREYNQQIYEQTLNTIQSLGAGPKFVFTHLEFPHYPYYYDSDGNPYPFEAIMKDHPGNQENYIRYVKYANGKLLQLVDAIMHNNPTPPMIVLISDHGYRCFPGNAVFYTFQNLVSVYMPDKNYSHFNDSITNVNLFRTILNTSFCQQLPMLRDSTISNIYVSNQGAPTGF